MNFGNEMNKLFGKVSAGKCRLSMDGKIAIETSNGYKTYNLKTGRLVNCDSFVFDIGEDMFFAIPTNHVRKGDIILVTGAPKCVIKAEPNQLTVLNYETNAIETIVPERHVFMGSMYFYSKIVSPFGGVFAGDTKKNNTNKLMRYYMMSEMFKGFNGSGDSSNGSGFGGFGAIAAMSMFGGGAGGMDDMFSGIFDFDEEEPEESDTDDNAAPEDGETAEEE